MDAERKAEAPQGPVYAQEDRVVGWLVPSNSAYSVVGECCATPEQRETLTPVWDYNIWPYRQTCMECGRDLVETLDSMPVLHDGQ